MAADLLEKTHRYQTMLACALEDISVLPAKASPLHRVATEFLEMAQTYYEDGTHFLEKNDLVNALVCFSYAHAWLDAGAKLGVFAVSRKELFTI